MKKYLKTTAILITVLMLGGCGGKGAPQGMRGEKGAPEGMPDMARQQEKSAAAVRTQMLSQKAISNEYMYSGAILPSDEVAVYSALNGKVAAVNFDVGDEVSAGDVLFAMDTESIENSVKISEAGVNSSKTSVAAAENNLKMANGASMEAQLENAKNSITNAQSSLKNAQTGVDNARAALSSAKISLDKAENDYNINKQLYEAGGLSAESMNSYKDAYDKAKNSYTQSELSLEQAENQYSSAQDSLKQAQTSYDILANKTAAENLTKAQDSLNQAKAQLESSRAQLESSKQSLKDAYVKAPISGTVSQCNVTAGASLSQGVSPFVIINTSSVDIKVNVSENMINSIKAGDSVRINIPVLSAGEDFDGTISYVSPDANSDGTYEVKVNLPNNDGALKSGMFARVYFTKEKNENALVLPRDCVITKDGESYVFAVEDGKAKKCAVETGIDNGDEVEIISGVTEGMTIVTEGQTYLSDGDSVNDVTNKAAEAAAPTESLSQIDEKGFEAKTGEGRK